MDTETEHYIYNVEKDHGQGYDGAAFAEHVPVQEAHEQQGSKS